MSYCNAWHEKIADKLESGDCAAAKEIAEDDSGSSTRCEYVLADIVLTQAKEIKGLRDALERIATRGYNADPYVELQRNVAIARDALGGGK